MYYNRQSGAVEHMVTPLCSSMFSIVSCRDFAVNACQQKVRRQTTNTGKVVTALAEATTLSYAPATYTT